MECVLFPFFPPLFFFFLFTMNKFTKYFEHHLAIQIINIKLFVRKLIKDKERYSFYIYALLQILIKPHLPQKTVLLENC